MIKKTDHKPTLYDLRIKAKLSQNELAHKAGITDTSYQLYEYGTRVPNVLTAILLARALETSVEKIWQI